MAPVEKPTVPLSGKKLLEYSQQFISRLNLNDLKKLVREDDEIKGIKLYMFRTKPLEKLFSLLEDRIRVATLNSQHLVVQVFLNNVILDGKSSNIEACVDGGPYIDLVCGNDRYELKTKVGVTPENLGVFINQYYNKMVEDLKWKNKWWFIFLMRRADAKVNKSIVCQYYLVVIEITEHAIVSRDNRAIIERSVELLKEAISEVAEEDVLDYIEDEGFLVPVHNFWIVERLRERVYNSNERELEAINRAEKAEAEKRKLEEATRQAMEEKRQAMEEKRQAEERANRLEEKLRQAEVATRQAIEEKRQAEERANRLEEKIRQTEEARRQTEERVKRLEEESRKKGERITWLEENMKKVLERLKKWEGSTNAKNDHV
ncbi:MAG: hypothetical protein ACTSRA_13925 [Promethearchaeota archaeon]